MKSPNEEAPVNLGEPHTPAVQTPRGETLLFEATGVSPMRIVSIVALVFALGSFILAAMLLQAEGGPGISSFERSLWAGGVLTFFVGFAIAVMLYQRRVAARITLAPDGRRLRVTTATLFGNRSYDVELDDLVVSQYHDGDRAGEEASNQPWLYVQTRGRPKSFVVPLHGRIPDKMRLLQVLAVR
jgi:hypothetical protein